MGCHWPVQGTIQPQYYSLKHPQPSEWVGQGQGAEDNCCACLLPVLSVIIYIYRPKGTLDLLINPMLHTFDVHGFLRLFMQQLHVVWSIVHACRWFQTIELLQSTELH